MASNREMWNDKILSQIVCAIIEDGGLSQVPDSESNYRYIDKL